MPSRRLHATLALTVLAVASGCGVERSTVGAEAPTEQTIPADPPTCGAIERFGEVVTDVSVAYDYTASASPAELAEQVDVVFGGTLTGATDTVTAEPDEAGAESWVGYEVEVDRVVAGGSIAAGDRVMVFVYHGASVRDPGQHPAAAGAARGAPVAIFAFDDPELGGWSSAIEGFVVSCDDGPLLGWTGARGGWAPLATVDDVLAAADPDAAVPPDREIAVTLWHCGVEPITVDGRLWEVPASETVDGDPMLPLDATNTPDDWVGRGTFTVTGDELTYVDEGGEVVDFVPDDGVPAGPCG